MRRAILVLCFMALAQTARSQYASPPPKKERSEAEERRYLDEQAQASRQSHLLVQQREQKKADLLDRFRIRPAGDSCHPREDPGFHRFPVLGLFA
ncbi:MAG TPA: hypothetical protein VJ385_06485 [Fibrobacteria bacterium]|nr:hypothetical protein [Fibrobacteria bacterium]